MTATPSTSLPDDSGSRDTIVRSPLGAWWQVYLHHLRLMRNSAVAWIIVLGGIGAGVAATFEDRIGTEAERALLAAMEDIPAFQVLVGRYVQIATLEGFVLSRWGMFAIFAAVWGMLTAVSLLRGAEDDGHVEPLRAGLITARGMLAAVLAALCTVYLILALAIGLSHSAAGMDTATSWALGGAVALLAATFAAAGALASQLAASRVQATSMVAAFLGVTLGMRFLAAATFTPDWFWWTTPFGWMGFLHEYDSARVAVFGSFTALFLVLVVAALALARRDIHAGWLADRQWGAERARPIGSHPWLALHLTARPAVTWSAGIGTLTLALGLLARDFVQAMADLPTQVALFARTYGIMIDTPEGIVAISFFFAAPLIAVFAAAQAAAIREEEASWRLEHLLVRLVGRTCWLITRVFVSAAALLLVAIVGGLLAWIGTVISGVPVAVGEAVLAGVNVVPVALLTLGIGVAAMGLVPRLTAALTYGLVVAAFLVDFAGPFLDLPDWVLELSPFRHIAGVPSAEMDLVPALIMISVGVVGTVVGLVRFRRRDLQEA